MSNPIFITGWALETDYPAGSNAWNGNPCKVAPTGDIFQPGNATTPAVVPAEWLNWLFNQHATAIQATQLASYLPSVQNWYPQQPLSAFTSLTNPFAFVAGCWDPLTTRYLLLAGDQINSKLQVFCSYGLDGSTQANWTALTQLNVGLPTGYGVSVCADATTSGNVWLAYGSTASGGQIITTEWNGSAWGVAGGSSFFNGSQLPFATNTALLPQLHVFQGTVYLSVGAPSTAGAFIGNADGGTNQVSSTHVCGTILMADNSGNGGPDNLLIAMPTHAGVTGGITYWTYNGTTWTSHTLTILGATNVNVFGLTWTCNATGPCFLLGVNNSSSLHTLFYTSTDGVTWTNVNGPLNTAQGSCLASTGDSRVVMGYVDISNGGPSGAAYSVDGGSTWYQSQDHFTSNNPVADAPYATYRQAVASPQSFMVFNALWFRFSATAGLPAAHL